MRPLTNGRLLLLARLVFVNGYNGDRSADDLTASVDQCCTLAQPLLQGLDEGLSGDKMKRNMKINPMNGKLSADAINIGSMDQTLAADDKDTEAIRIPHLNIVLLVGIIYEFSLTFALLRITCCHVCYRSWAEKGHGLSKVHISDPLICRANTYLLLRILELIVCLQAVGTLGDVQVSAFQQQIVLVHCFGQSAWPQ